MNLRVKTLLVIGTSMFLFLGLLLLIASPFLYNDSITLDESQTMKNVERLHNELDSENDILFRMNRDGLYGMIPIYLYLISFHPFLLLIFIIVHLKICK